LLLRNVWLLLLVTIVLTFLSGGRLRTRMDRVLVGVVALHQLVTTPLSLMFASGDGNLLQIRPDAQIAGAVDTAYRALDCNFGQLPIGGYVDYLPLSGQRRMRDSNPRGREPNPLSKSANRCSGLSAGR
jgi:hypothetical protein